MSKTYSLATQNKSGHWITNYQQYFNIDDIDWGKVETFCKERGDLAYGYYYGHNSRNLVSSKCRTVVKKLPVQVKNIDFYTGLEND